MNMKTDDKTKHPTPAPQQAPDQDKNLPMIHDFGEDAGKGMENVRRGEYRIPFLSLLQSNSPQVDPDNGAFVPGAKAGMFFNTATNEFYAPGDQGLLIVPAFRDGNFVEYTPRNLGGGMVGIHPAEDPAIVNLVAATKKKLGLKPHQQVFGKLSTATRFSNDGLPLDGTEFIETYYLYVLVCPVGRKPFGAMLAFKSTQIKKYQAFVGRYMGFEYRTTKGLQSPAIWAHKWSLGARGEKNKKGSFQGYVLTLWEKNEDGSEKDSLLSLMKMDDPLYIGAKELNRVLSTGEAKGDIEAMASNDQKSDAEDDDIPM